MRARSYAAPVVDRAVRGVRSSLAGLAAVAVVAVLVPGVGAYVALRALGAPLAAAGLGGLFLMFAGTFAYCAWLYGGGRRTAGSGGAPRRGAP